MRRHQRPRITGKDLRTLLQHYYTTVGEMPGGIVMPPATYQDLIAQERELVRYPGPKPPTQFMGVPIIQSMLCPPDTVYCVPDDTIPL